MSKLNILSEPIRSGKTTTLIRWVENNPGGFAILMPDLCGKRKLYIPSKNIILPIEAESPALDCVQIGRFRFMKSTFEMAGNLLNSLDFNGVSYILIDEIGKLEFRDHSGFEPWLSQFLGRWQSVADAPNLYLVIRNFLLDEACGYYRFTNINLLRKYNFGNYPVKINPDFQAMVLCGGQSRRMNKNKALISYHSIPQYQYACKQLQRITPNVFLSVNQENYNLFTPEFKQLCDRPQFTGNGPASAVLSFIELFPNQPLLLLGCDYPALRTSDIELLADCYRLTGKSCFLAASPESYTEPLLALYTSGDLKIFKENAVQLKFSLSELLKQCGAIRLISTKPESLKSFDTPEDFAQFEI